MVYNGRGGLYYGMIYTHGTIDIPNIHISDIYTWYFIHMVLYTHI